MEQQIYDTRRFPFTKVNLGKPLNQNGAYFIKMHMDDSPIYIQPPKCFIKQGILKSGKKLFCDLVFSIEDSYFLNWLEQIEEISKTKIFENRANWFETELDEHDIENSLISPYKMYKSGKFFVIRTNIPTTLGKCDLKIYDENETEILHEDVKDETNVITIVELKGIKCSARNFQFVFDVRQMLVVSPVKLFEKCIIRKRAPSAEPETELPTQNGRDPSSALQLSQENSVSTSLEQSHTKETTENVQDLGQNDVITDIPQTPQGLTDSVNGESNRIAVADTETSNDTSSVNSASVGISPQECGASSFIADLVDSRKANSSPNDLFEVAEFDLAELANAESMQLKPRNDVYYKMYKAAKQKAKEAKLIALSNYLEAKRLKTTYLLEVSSDSDSDIENDENDSENDDA
jgi:hypothetical protein